MGKVYKGDIGTKIVLDTKQNIVLADVMKIYYTKPDGTVGNWIAEKEADNQSVSYTTISVNDLNIAGLWKLMAYVEIPSWKGYGETVDFIVYSTFDDILTAPAIVVGTNSWISIVNADIYMGSRFRSDDWELLSAKDKTKLLVSAYYQLSTCGLFEFPSDITINMLNAQCEMALFILKHQEDADARKGLQAQGVISAGIVQETYDKDMLQQLPIPPIVKGLLSVYDSSSPLEGVEAERDDDSDI